MLDLSEKIAAGVCGLFVVVTLVAYLWLGVPSTTPGVFVPGVQEAPRSTTKTASAAERGPSPEDLALLDKLSQQNPLTPKNQPLERKQLTVPRELFDRVSDRANWLEELQNYNRVELKGKTGNSRLRVQGISEGSLLEKLGLEDNDTIELLDGQIVEFREAAATQYNSMWNAALKKLREGQSISVTVTRKNRPVHLEFKL